MKARVKATGEIVHVHTHDDADFQDRQGRLYWEHQLIFDVTDKDAIYNKGWQDGWDEAVKSEIPKIHPKLKGSDPDYWEKLLHQYAGMAMQGLMTILPNIGGIEDRTPKQEIVDIAIDVATALVEKLKEEENYDKERTA